MSKPIDVKGGPWTRRMVPNTVFDRFGYTLKDLDWSNSSKGTLPGMPYCPECNAGTYARRDSFRNNAGEEVVVFFPHCIVNDNANHGYGRDSIHGTRAPQGPKGPRGPKLPKVETPAPAPAPPLPSLHLR